VHRNDAGSWWCEGCAREAERSRREMKVSDRMEEWPGAEIRPSDGYWNATRFCEAHEKSIGAYLALEAYEHHSNSTRELHETFARHLDVAVEHLVQTAPDGTVWVEPKLIVDIAM
jgi:hypothetical protein